MSPDKNMPSSSHIRSRQDAKERVPPEPWASSSQASVWVCRVSAQVPEGVFKSLSFCHLCYHCRRKCHLRPRLSFPGVGKGVKEAGLDGKRGELAHYEHVDSTVNIRPQGKH